MNTQSELDRSDINMPEEAPRKRGTEGSQVIINQNIAAREFSDKKVRKFRREVVEIETLGGCPIRVPMWVSDEKPSIARVKKRKEINFVECEVCGRCFDERRKMLIHLRSHKSGKTVVKKGKGRGKNVKKGDETTTMHEMSDNLNIEEKIDNEIGEKDSKNVSELDTNTQEGDMLKTDLYTSDDNL